MSLSLDSVAPLLFLHLEARYGPSTLQDYDGILRKQVFGSRLDVLWRLTIGTLVIMPLGLNAAYKTFDGGSSTLTVNPADYFRNTSYYGMFAPPGLQLLGERTGITLLSNATLPFLVAASPIYGTEPPLPVDVQAYGFNILWLDEETTAVLDIPQQDYISTVQKFLASGESWKLTAPILGTVAKFSDSQTTDSNAYNVTFMSRCRQARASSGNYTGAQMLQDSTLVLLDSQTGDQSFSYIGLPPTPHNHDLLTRPDCSLFSHYAQLYHISRRSCTGSWVITRGGIQLVSGGYDDTILPPEKQIIYTNVDLTYFSHFYMPSLLELVGAFGEPRRNESDWKRSFMATGVAAMHWSRITVKNGAGNLAESHDQPIWNTADNDNLSLVDTGLIYPVDDTVVYTRPTLRKSRLLYFVFAIQPVLTLIFVALMACILNSTPVDKGFGLMSILSGIDRDSLNVVKGASLSG